MVAAVAFLLALPVLAAETITPIADILKNRDLANGRNFCVVGKPVEIKEKVGEVTGKHLFRGKIDDGTGQLTLFAYGRFPAIHIGEAIEVCGKYTKFYLSKGNNPYHNQIEARAILKGKMISAGLVDIVNGEVAVRPKKRAPGPPSP